MKRKIEKIEVILPAAGMMIGTDKESGFARRACVKIFSGFFRDGPTPPQPGMILSKKDRLIIRRKFLSTDAIRAGWILEILGFRGWKNPARRSKQRTGWAPATESPRFLSWRPAEGEEIFS